MTTGAYIVGNLLRAFAPLLAKVPAARIKAGALPDDIELPALLVRRISKVERQALIRGATTRTIDRISVTVRAANYRDQVDVIQLVEECCAGKTGAIGGGQSVSILTAGTGPDLRGPADTFEQGTDFRVSYDA